MQISNQEFFKLLGTTSDVGNTSCGGCYGPATTPHRLSPKCPREAAGSCWGLILHICQSFRNIEKCFEKQRYSRPRRISKPSVFLAQVVQNISVTPSFALLFRTREDISTKMKIIEAAKQTLTNLAGLLRIGNLLLYRA